MNEITKNENKLKEKILEINPYLFFEKMKKKSIYGYEEQNMDVIKISYTNPDQIFKLKKKIYQCFPNIKLNFYEDDLKCEYRFLIENELFPCGWIKIDTKKYDNDIDGNIHIVVDNEDIQKKMCMENSEKIAPFCTLSFDIECINECGHFPNANDPNDSIIQISNVVHIYGQDEPLIKCIFSVKETNNIEEGTVISFENEKEMLKGWAFFVKKINPDIITGYNIINFDFPYIFDRAKILGIENILFFIGKIPNEKVIIKDGNFSSKAYGKRKDKEIHIPGRIIMDMLFIIIREHNLRSYKLNDVCKFFLNDTKEDVHHKDIFKLYCESAKSRATLAKYCLKDALLPLKLMLHLMTIENFSEMAKVTGVPISDLMTKGQQIRVLSQLYRKIKNMDYIVPNLKENGEEDFNNDFFEDDVNYEGGFVMEPERGFYNIPVVTLDFSSLYPSIMIAHNLCYSTWINNNKCEKENIKTPVGAVFVKKEIKKGILPEILENLLYNRKKVREQLKNEIDLTRKKILNGRQLALKICANSVYGFTGANYGKLPCLEISGSVTAFGRQMLQETKKLIEEQYCKKKVLILMRK